MVRRRAAAAEPDGLLGRVVHPVDAGEAAARLSEHRGLPRLAPVRVAQRERRPVVARVAEGAAAQHRVARARPVVAAGVVDPAAPAVLAMALSKYRVCSVRGYRTINTRRHRIPPGYIPDH